jgi:squalene-associated FAD-dependent desaturase
MPSRPTRPAPRGIRARIAVVGGGLAGITAALECADRGAAVALYEARPRLGGATFSIQRDGLWHDNGQHVFLRCCTAYLEFLKRLGVESRVVLQDRLSIPVVAPDGRSAKLERTRLPAPLHLAAAIARYGFLTPRERLHVIPAVLALRRVGLDDPSLDERTFAEWLHEHGQSPRAVSVLWNLITVPAVNLPAREASLALAAKVFKTGLLEDAAAGDIGYAAVPLQQLHGDAASHALAEAGVETRVRARVSSLEELSADAIVIAVPPEDAMELLPPGALAADPRGLGASPIVNVHVVYDRQITELPLAAGLETPVQFVFDRTASSGLERGQYLAVSISGASGYETCTLDDLRADFVPALAELFPAARGARVERFLVTREPQATFRGVPGSGRLRPGPRTGIPGVFVAGAWTDTGWPATMEGAVRSGKAAAREACSHVAARVTVKRPSRARQEVP